MKGKEILKKSKGITLIALVITIIVLLILAGVTIATLTGDNGILTKAGNAKTSSTEAEVLEKLKLAYEDYYLGHHTQTGYTFQNALDKMFGTGVATATGPDSKGVYTVSVNGKTYAFNSITGTADEKKIETLNIITKDNYGDYIDLGQNVVGTSATTDDWRILYNDKNGHVYAILADYLPNNNPAVTASGLDTSGTYLVYSSSSSRDDFLSKLNNTTGWQSLIPEGLRSTCKVKGATTAEILMASYNEKYGTSLEYTSYPILYIDADSSKGVDTLYMPHPGNDAYEGCKGYFLNTLYDDDQFNVYRVFRTGMIDQAVYNSYATCGVCPVVSLPSNIQVTKNGTVWTVEQ